MFRKPVFTLIALVLLLVACTAPNEPDAGSVAIVPPTQPPAAESSAPDLSLLQGHIWQLSDATGTNPPTLEFLTDQQLGGSGGCNRWFGGWAITDGRLHPVGPFGSTMMACEEGVMKQEAEFLQALEKVTAITLEGDLLQATGPDVTLTFVRQEPPAPLTLKGTLWLLNSFVSADAVSSTLAGSTISAEIRDDMISGSAGCNRYFASLIETGGRLEIGPLGMTRMACEDGLMQQEALFARILQAVTGWQIDGHSLTLTTADGEALVFSGEAMPEATLEGPTWSLLGFQTGEMLASPLTNTVITVTFEGGNVGGNAGCNSFGGSYSVDGTQLTIGQDMFSTAMSCGDETDAQERRFLQALASAESFTLADGKLMISHAGGELVFSADMP
jgi:heat shock protein HslJ